MVWKSSPEMAWKFPWTGQGVFIHCDITAGGVDTLWHHCRGCWYIVTSLQGVLIHCDITTGGVDTLWHHYGQQHTSQYWDGPHPPNNYTIHSRWEAEVCHYHVTVLYVAVMCRKVKFDHLDKAFCMMKLSASQCGCVEQWHQQVFRVDLIVTPPRQYACALLSWTGSKVIWWITTHTHTHIFTHTLHTHNMCIYGVCHTTAYIHSNLTDRWGNTLTRSVARLLQLTQCTTRLRWTPEIFGVCEIDTIFTARIHLSQIRRRNILNFGITIFITNST